MREKKSTLELAQENAQAAIDRTNKMIEELGNYANTLCSTLNDIQECFDRIRNVPTEKKLKCDELKGIRLNWKQQAKKIERDYAAATVKKAGAGVAGLGTGVAVAALGPSAAMGVATTFGVASTGTAISALSGAAATNAALAWLGGGVLTAGGGGMAAGKAILALAGPTGWAIAGVALVASGFALVKSWTDEKKVEDVFAAISNRDVHSYELAIIELHERIKRIGGENKLLMDAIQSIKQFGQDYNAMTEAQQYELGCYVNFMNASTQLLVNPISGLQPRFSEKQLKEFLSQRAESNEEAVPDELRPLVLVLTNLLYKVNLDRSSKHLLYKVFCGNKNFLEEMGIDKKLFTENIMDVVEDALFYSYSADGQSS